MTGCSNSQKILAAEDYTLVDGMTSKNICVGNNSKEFSEAYQGYRSLVDYWDDDNNSLQDIDIKNIDYSRQCTVWLSTYFIDGEPINIVYFMKENNIDNITTWMADNNYLDDHAVIVKHLTFDFEKENEISNIHYYETNCNEEWE